MLNLMLPSAEEVFATGWLDALNDNTIPLENLWDGIDAEQSPLNEHSLAEPELEPERNQRRTSMLTIKNVLPNEHEDVVQVRRVTYQPEAVNASETAGDGRIVWGELENGTTVPFSQGTVYVMNDNGRTVATYTLHYPKPDKQFAEGGSVR